LFLFIYVLLVGCDCFLSGLPGSLCSRRYQEQTFMDNARAVHGQCTCSSSTSRVFLNLKLKLANYVGNGESAQRIMWHGWTTRNVARVDNGECGTGGQRGMMQCTTGDVAWMVAP
jgi:hypothetical protein